MKTLLVIAIVLMTPVVSNAIDLNLVGGAAIAYNAVGPDHDAGNNWNLYYYAGTRVVEFGEPSSGNSLWGIVHHVGVEGTDVSGWGGKVAVVSKIQQTDFYLLSGLGFVEGFATNSDGTQTGALYGDFGLSWDASELIDVAVGLQAIDRGPEFGLSIHGTFIITDPTSLFGGGD